MTWTAQLPLSLTSVPTIVLYPLVEMILTRLYPLVIVLPYVVTLPVPVPLPVESIPKWVVLPAQNPSQQLLNRCPTAQRGVTRVTEPPTAPI